MLDPQLKNAGKDNEQWFLLSLSFHRLHNKLIQLYFQFPLMVVLIVGSIVVTLENFSYRCSLDTMTISKEWWYLGLIIVDWMMSVNVK